MQVQAGGNNQPSFALIDFNSLEDLRKFGVILANQLLNEPCHSLRALEERYSLVTGIAVRYCQLLAREGKIDRLLAAVHHSWQPNADQQFFSTLMGLKKALAGGQEGIELSTIKYHGREFTVRAIFGGWFGEMFPNKNGLYAQKNHLTGSIHFYVYEEGKQIAKVKFQRWLKLVNDYGATDETLIQGNLDALNADTLSHRFEGGYISDYEQSDTLLGHFLHQLYIEMSSIAGCEDLSIEAHDEGCYIAYTNGFWPFGKDDEELHESVVSSLEAGSLLTKTREGGSAIYRIKPGELSQARVYFNGCAQPVCWHALIEQCPIITTQELFLWPEFRGFALPNTQAKQLFHKQTVDLEQSVTCESLIQIGRSGMRQNLVADMKNIEVCQTDVLPLSSHSVLLNCFILSQFKVLFESDLSAALLRLEQTLQIDPSGALCRSMFNAFIDASLAFERHDQSGNEHPESYGNDPLSVEEGVLPAMGLLVDLTNIIFEAETQYPESKAIQICKQALAARINDAYSNLHSESAESDENTMTL